MLPQFPNFAAEMSDGPPRDGGVSETGRATALVDDEAARDPQWLPAKAGAGALWKAPTGVGPAGAYCMAPWPPSAKVSAAILAIPPPTPEPKPAPPAAADGRRAAGAQRSSELILSPPEILSSCTCPSPGDSARGGGEGAAAGALVELNWLTSAGPVVGGAGATGPPKHGVGPRGPAEAGANRACPGVAGVGAGGPGGAAVGAGGPRLAPRPETLADEALAP